MPRHCLARLGAILATAAAWATPVEAQTGAREPLSTRVAIVQDATVCACMTNGAPAPRIRDLTILAVGRSRTVAGNASGAWRLDYVPELLPLIISSRTADDRLRVWHCGPRQYCGASDDDEVWGTNAVGAGVLPLALGFTWQPAQLFLFRWRASAGAVLLTRPVPLAQGTNFNFLAETGISAGLRLSRQVVMTAGVVVNHISNGGLSDVNLGMDSRMLEIGALLRR